MPVPNTIADLNQAAASNFPLGTDTVGPNLDDYLRAGFAFTRQLFDGTPRILTGIAGGETITATCPVPFTAYVPGMWFVYTPIAINTSAAPTLNINALGAKTITQVNGQGIWAAAFMPGNPYLLYYDGVNMRVIAGFLGNNLNTAQIPIPGASASFRNRFIDGNFDFWDTNLVTSPASGVDTYVSSMWLANTGSGGACTVSRQIFPLGGDPNSNTTPSKYYMQWQQTGSASTNPVLGQKIEGVGTFQGRSVTLSVTLWVASGSITIPSVKAVQNFGTGGSPSAQVVTTVATNWNVTTAAQRFSVRIDVPSIAGKTLGTGGNDNIFIALNLPSGATFTLIVTQAQVEDCPAGAPAIGMPTPFEFRGLDYERTRIKRFLRVYSSGVANQNVGTAVIATGTTFGINYLFEDPMRAAPVLVWANLSYGISVVTAISSLAINVATAQSVSLAGTSAASGFSGGQVANVITTTTAGFLFFDARL